MTSGQLFRWRLQADRAWFGVDGDHWYFATPDDGAWNVESNAASSDFERLFRIDSEWDRVFDQLWQRGPELEPLIRDNPGLRLCRPSDTVETMFSFLCSSNNHVARIGKMVEHLASFGPVLVGALSPKAHRFPNLDTLAGLQESELRSRGFGYRAATIPVVARQLVERGAEPYLSHLAVLPAREAREELIALPGVGPKLADCILLFALGRTETVPIDTHVWKALTRHYFLKWQGAALTPMRYREAAEYLQDRFGPLAGWAQQFLFFDNMLNWRALRAQESKDG